MKTPHLIACLSLMGCLASGAQAFIIIDPGTTGATDVVQDPDGTPVVLTNPLADPLLLGGDELAVGDTAVGELLISKNSDVSSNSGFVGKEALSTGTVTVDGAGSTWTNAISLFVGESGDGTLMIQSGGVVSDALGYIGRLNGSTGTATVTGSGSTWTNLSLLRVGDVGNGTLNIQNGGTVTNSMGYIGRVGTSTSTATVNGAGSTWTNSSTLFVGNAGDGSLNIQNGGVVSNVLGDIATFIGSTGSALVTGNGSAWNSSGDLNVGNAGNGTLTVSGGGSVSNVDGYIGKEVGSVSSVTVAGTNSTWTNSNQLTVGNSGDGTLTIQSGGTVSNTDGFVGFGSGSTGLVTVDGTGSTWAISNELTVGGSGSGTLTIQNGGGVSAGGLSFSSVAVLGIGGLTSLVTVDGIGSTLDSTGGLLVGGGGGALVVQNGASVSDDSLQIGFSGMGTVTVDGIGSTWTNTNAVVVGGSGDGTLTIQNGGSVSSDLFGAVGFFSGFTGLMTVNGTGSTWTSLGDLTVGSSGNGTLAIQLGGVVSNSMGDVGSLSGSTGIVTVDGPGSAWNNSIDLTVGNLGNGTMTVSTAGAVTNVDGFIDKGIGSVGAATVDGVGSSWTNSGELTVGDNGDGTLTIQNGGDVSNANGYVGFVGGSTGTATVTGAGSTWTNSGGLFVGGRSTAAGGTGTLNIQNSGLVQADGIFKIWTDGTVNLAGGTLELNGPLESGGGTLNFTAGVMNVNDATQLLVADGGDKTVGGLSLGSTFSLNTGQTLNIAGSARVDLGGQLTLGGGTLSTPSLLVQAGGSVVNNAGSSTVTSPVLMLAGSSINVAGGDLTIGNAAAVNGFASAGTTNVGNNSLTLLDANDAVFDSLALVTLGDGVGGAGTLAAANGLTLNFGGNVAGFGTVNTPNDPFKLFINNGNISGNSALEPITLTGYVKGVGTLNNVVITGTDAPGFSPATVYRGSVAYAGELQIEVGGLSEGSFDIVNHSGTATLGGTLDLSLINGFTPSENDTFQFLTASNILGTFNTILGADLGGGLAFDVIYGLNDVTLEVISTALAGDLDGDGFVGISDLNIVLGNWNQNVPPANPLADPSGDGFVGIDDLNTVLGNWNAGTPPGTSASIPEPGTMLLLALGGLALMRRDGR
jgi:T5SS/PEP-CTERM-associated repeat protein